MARKYLLAMYLGAVVFSCPLLAGAQVRTGQPAFSSYVATEQFQWKESTPQKPDFLSESGTHVALGVVYSNAQSTWQGLYYGVDARVFGGSVDYSGNAFSLTDSASGLKPFDSTTRYLGNRIQFDTGYRIPFATVRGVKAFDITFALGSDYRERHFGGGQLDDGTPVQGYLETYEDIYAKAGVGLMLHTGSQVHRIYLGVKRPLHVGEVIDFSSLGARVHLEPVPATSGYASWQLYPATPQSSSLTLSMYMEQTKYDSSAAQSFAFTLGNQTHTSAIYQPDTEFTVTGLKVHWEF